MNGLVRKLTDTEFLEYISQYDIIFLSETWISKKDQLKLEINGYKSVHIFGNKSPMNASEG